MQCPCYSAPVKGSDALSSKRKNSFFGGAAILAVGVFIVKILGFVYNVSLAKILSYAAFADFNTAFYVYCLLIVISTGGLPIALSKMVAESNTLHRFNQTKKIFRVSMTLFCIMGTMSFLIMACFPHQLAAMMNNESSYYSILALAPAVFFICPLSAFRGYFQGHSEMSQTAVSQIIEGICKLIVGFLVAFILLKQYQNESLAAGGAILGVSVGAGLALAYMFYRYLRKKRASTSTQDTPAATNDILRKIIKLAIPITLGSSIIAVVSVIDTSLVFARLQHAAGYTEEAARTIKGVFDQAMTLYNMPASFMAPLTTSIIPAVSSARARKDHLSAARVSETALRTTVLLAFPAGIGLFVLGQPIMELIYPGEYVALGGWLLSMLGLASIMVCLMLVSNAIMQAYGYVNLPMMTTIIGCVLKIVTNYILVGNGAINIKGAPIGSLVCFGSMTLLNLIFIKRVIPTSPNYVRVFVKPLIASVLMGATAWALNGLFSRISFIGPKFGVLLAISVAGCVYVVLVIAIRAISYEDLMLMPKGEKIAKFLRVK
jgi:stage V sporulation protein B